MKLIFCPVCSDVFQLNSHDWRVCVCGRSGGQYNPDNLTATVGGIAKVFGIPNPLFDEAYMAPIEVIIGLREKYNKLWSTEVWWGEYKGDWQIIRVRNPNGHIPDNWEKRVSRLKAKGGVEGYNTKNENELRRVRKLKALLRFRTRSFCRNLFNWVKYPWTSKKP